MKTHYVKSTNLVTMLNTLSYKIVPALEELVTSEGGGGRGDLQTLESSQTKSAISAK